MKDILKDLLERLKGTSAQTRVLLAVGIVLITGTGLYSVWRGKNPHMGFYQSGMDNAEFSAVTGALGKAGIRFSTSTGGAPYTVWVEESMRYEANAIVAQESALQQGPRGIDTSSGSSAFDASIERVQKTNARFWQEVEKSLETMTWVDRAKVTAFFSDRLVLGRREQPTVSVILTTNRLHPDPAQAQAVANIVQKSFHTDPDNVSIVDQHGQTLFDGTRDESLDEVLAFERAFDLEQTQRVQDILDATYGPGLARASVHGEWTYDRTESVDETLDPKGKVVRETTTKSSTPGLVAAGGPAGVQENLTIAQGPGVGKADPATRSDTEKQFAFGTRTTHKLQTQPQLMRLTLGLILDASLEDQLSQAEQVVKGIVGFDQERGDQFAAHSTALHGIERDDEGNPIAAAPIAPPEAPNPWIDIALRHGIEGLAALVFLIVLVRSLKGSDKTLRQAAADSQAQVAKAQGLDVTEAEEPIELDPEVLARKQVEQLIDTDPERVSALLSRWAMGDSYYAESGA